VPRDRLLARPWSPGEIDGEKLRREVSKTENPDFRNKLQEKQSALERIDETLATKEVGIQCGRIPSRRRDSLRQPVGPAELPAPERFTR
jgi:hypothetical protein